MSEEISRATVRPEDRSRPLTVDLQERTFKAYPVMTEELDMFASIYSSINQTFLGVMLGVVFTIMLALWTGEIRSDSQVNYKMALGASLLATAYFGLRVLADSRQARERISRIRSRRPPESEEGRGGA